VALSPFDDEAAPPEDPALEEMLGRATGLWTRLREDLQSAHGPLVEEWHFSGKAYGWSLRLKRGKGTIVHMTPCRAYFLASFALGEKACLAAHAGGLPSPVLKLIDDAPRYAEGRGVRIPVRTKRDVESIARLVAIKLERRPTGPCRLIPLRARGGSSSRNGPYLIPSMWVDDMLSDPRS